MSTATGAIVVISDQTEIHVDDCVAVEQAGQNANVRRVADTYCDPASAEVVSNIQDEAMEEAQECAAAKAELAALKAALPVEPTISLHPLKPYTGHSVGANGVLDCAILADYLQNRELPPNLQGITCPGQPFSLQSNALSEQGSTVLKIAVGMGGHNSIVSLRSPSIK